MRRSTPELRVELDPELTDGLRARLLEIWTDVSNAGGAVGFVPPVTTDDIRAVADPALRRVGEGEDHLAVASSDGRPVGFLFLTQRPGPLFRHWATLKRLQVDPSLQGGGIGGRLLREAEGLARERLGLEQIHLTVRGGTGTEAFYLRHGYEEVARLPGLIRVAPGDDREEIYLIKHLG